MRQALYYVLSRIDWMLLLLLLLMLFGVGMFALKSAAPSEAVTARQTLYVYIGLVVMLGCACVSWRAWKWLALPMFVGCVVMLVLVQLFGIQANNSRRWLDIGLLTVQPSEFTKVATPLLLACWYCLFKKHRLWQHAVAIVLLAIPTLLVFRQPDLGTAVMIAASGALVVFFAGLSWWIINGGIALGLLAAPLVWNNLLKDYQRDRILAALDPSQDPLGVGYHTIQSSIAVGSGGLWGKGWGLGSQSQLGFLPEKHTDFIFAVFAEEHGFVGSLVLLGLMLLLFIRMIFIAINAHDQAGRLAAAAIGSAFLLQLLVNLGMVSGLLPVVGLPLPLVSYGGTSLLTYMLGCGILMSIAMHKPAGGMR